MVHRSIVVAASAIFLCPLCLAQSQPGAADRTSQDANAIANTTDPHAQMDAAHGGVDAAFFKNAASDNTLEVRLAQMALQKTDDAQVKQVAQMMIADHTQANEMIKKISDEKALAVSTDQLNPVDQAEFDELQEKQGAVFTHQFLFDQVGDHTKDVLNYAYHANHADPVTQQYAKAVLPKLRMHLAALEGLAYPMAGEGAPSHGDAAP